MGSYCDRCYLFTGGISNDNSLKPIGHYDLCEKCFPVVWRSVMKEIDKGVKLNKIGHSGL